MSDTSDQSEGSERCTHIVEALDGPEKVALSGKYKTAAAWYFQRVQDAIHPSKRRKVCNQALKHTNLGADTKRRLRRRCVEPAVQRWLDRSSVYIVRTRVVGRRVISVVT